MDLLIFFKNVGKHIYPNNISISSIASPKSNNSMSYSALERNFLDHALKCFVL